MDLLIKYGHMEWQGTLKETYNKYLHPDVLEYDEPKMWDILLQIYDIFQFFTPIAIQALSKTNARTVMDLSATNSLLRLKGEDGKENPLDTYARYKKDINEWVKDCVEYGLNQDEMDILSRHLSTSYMLADSQEKIMILSMDKNVSNFTLKGSNLLRKAISKKDEKSLNKAKLEFYESGLKAGTRQIFLEYVWNEVFAKSFGYSFSQPHSYAYSVIALQQLNLNYFYPPVYWNCGCLIAESTNEDKSKATDYGKMCKAIYSMKNSNINILPPSINDSEFGFTPVEKTNSIVYGLIGISGINKEIADQIILNRPYSSFKQFYDTHKYQGSAITKSKFINLIKSGCFDEFNTNRVSLMKWLCFYENTPKTSLDGKNMASIAKLGVKLDKDLLKAYNYKQYVCSKQFFYCDDSKFKSKKHYIIEPKFALPYFTNNIMSELKENIDYYYDNDNLIVIDKSLEKALKPQLTALSEQLKTKETLDDFNKKMLQFEYSEMVDNDNVNQWSFDTVCFFHDKHILADVDLSQYSITSFNDLPEEPKFIEKSWGKKTWKQYELSRIAGIVLDRDDTKHIVTILTDDDEVVGVKFYAGAYSHYKQTIAMEDDKDSNWFARGNLLMVSGFRSDDNNFVAKKYANSIFQHSVILIKQINKDGSLDVQLERFNKDSEEE